MLAMTQKKFNTPVHKLTHRLFFLHQRHTLPYLFLFLTICILLLGDLLLADNPLWLYNVFYNHLHTLPGMVGEAMPLNIVKTVPLAQGFIWLFIALFILYFLALRILPDRISYSYLIRSTMAIGFFYILIPIVTSQDVFSYIAYARMAAIYHLNPMTVPPTAIEPDYVYGFLYWVHQPSVYGPTWLAITAVIQQFATIIGFRYVLSMELLLRFFSLGMHLGSTQLVWIMSGHLQNGLIGSPPLVAQTRRIRATLAFAWNPFLLLESCVNAHNDVTILFLLLLVFRFLLPSPAKGKQPYIVATILLALIACLKISYVVLMPGFLMFLLLQRTTARSWRFRIQDVLTAVVIYASLIIILHAAFWENGALFGVLSITPSATRDINSFYELFVHIYAQIKGIPMPREMDRGSYLEIFSHTLSTGLFVLTYMALCIYSLKRPHSFNTVPALMSWMAFAWLLYCVVGSPWFWPWYAVILFGLFACIEATQSCSELTSTLFGPLDVILFGRLLAVSMVGLYGLWIFYNLYPDFQPRYLTSLPVWGIPFLVVGLMAARARHRKNSSHLSIETISTGDT